MIHYLQKVNFTTSFGDHVSFDENGDALAIYDVMNWQPSSDGSIVVRTVGVVDEGATSGKVLTLDEDALYWNFETKKVNLKVKLSLLQIYSLNTIQRYGKTIKNTLMKRLKLMKSLSLCDVQKHD